MSRTLKLLVTGLVTVLALSTAAVPAYATTDAARSAARWVATQPPDEARAGDAADALIALAAGQDPSTSDDVPTLLGVVRQQGTGFVADGAEAAAKLVIALDAVGEDPRTFLPGVDLVAEVKAGVQADGAFGAWPGPFASGMGATALARAGELVPAALITNLATFRNGDGGFGFAAGGPSDADSTALAILALLAANEPGMLADAIAWSHATQAEDGSWAGYSMVNSTAILGASLATAGEPVDKALAYLSTQQQTSGEFLTSEGKPDTLATRQAVLLLAGVSYFDVTWDLAGSPGAAADTCDGVWVVVRDQSARCAPEYATGKDALRSAGFATRDSSPGFLCQISGQPSTCTTTPDAHWAYWQASRNADGTWGPWRYSGLGYTATSPQKGDAEGWVFGAGQEGPQPPAPPPAPEPAPAAEPVASESPTPVGGDAGSPLALIATAGAVLLGGCALGGWWFLRRRGA